MTSRSMSGCWQKSIIQPFTVYLGDAALKGGWQEIIHRKKRCGLSLFQVGLRFLRRLLRKGLPLPKAFVEPLIC